MIRRLCWAGALAFGLLATSIPTAHAATVSPSTWAPKFCGAIEKYQTTISDAQDEMDTALEGVTNLTEGRAQIVSFLGEMVTAAKTAKRAIERAGNPSSPNGAKIEAQFVKALDASADIFTDAKAKAAEISTKSPTAFAKQGKQVGVDLTNAGEKLSSGFSGIGKLDKGKKLEAAVRAAPECEFLT
ncbi:MAG TPA: hypothetical protein VK549_11005 [Acidimicrobiia bacterium]|nr:hypothetical protein [Acidimicrobiia bacterium]